MTLAAGGRGHCVVAVHAPPVTLTAGGVTQARLAVVVADGYHVQANPASGDFFVPLQLNLKGSGGVRPGGAIYPPGNLYRLPGTSDDLLTYKGAFEVVVPLRAGPSARPGGRRLKGQLRYQACDARTCLFPSSLPVELTVRVVAAPAKPSSRRGQ